MARWGVRGADGDVAGVVILGRWVARCWLRAGQEQPPATCGLGMQQTKCAVSVGGGVGVRRAAWGVPSDGRRVVGRCVGSQVMVARWAAAETETVRPHA